MVPTDINPESLAVLKAEVAELTGAEPLTFQMDVTKAEQIQGVVDQVIAAYGKIDVLCNNAGVSSMVGLWI